MPDSANDAFVILQMRRLCYVFTTFYSIAAPIRPASVSYTHLFAAAHHKHQQMGCICFENPSMGIYFISDPDGYWLEVVPGK